MCNFIWIALLLLCSCTRSNLTVQTDFLSRKSLASYYVDTPDPNQNHPPLGERLIIHWSLPPSFQSFPDLQLNLTVRFGNRTEITETYRLNKLCGYQVYKLSGDQYIAKRGIFTYKATISSHEKILETFTHQMWINLIQP